MFSLCLDGFSCITKNIPANDMSKLKFVFVCLIWNVFQSHVQCFGNMFQIHSNSEHDNAFTGDE